MNKSNLPDVLMLLLKAQILDKGVRQVRLSKDHVFRAENFDLKMEQKKGSDEIVLSLVETPADDNDAKLILPNQSNPFKQIRKKRSRLILPS